MKQITDSGHVLLIHFSDANKIALLAQELAGDPSTAGKTLVLVDDELEELPGELLALGVKFVRGNPARQATLERANHAEATHAIVLAKDPKDPRSDDLNLAVAMTIEGLNATIHSVVECVDVGSTEILLRTGCDSIVCASQFSSSLLVQELIDPGVQSVFAELTSVSEGQQFYVVRIEAMKDWTFAELKGWADARRYVTVGVRRAGKVHLNPENEFTIEKADSAVLIGARRLEAVNTV